MKAFALIVTFFAAFVAAGLDYCIPGSDSICKRYGMDYCCAKIEIEKNGIKDSYHSCASRSGIEYMDN